MLNLQKTYYVLLIDYKSIETYRTRGTQLLTEAMDNHFNFLMQITKKVLELFFATILSFDKK